MKLYLFFRPEGFYPLQLSDDETAVAHAECNPGTVKVEEWTGRLVWPVPVEVAA
ncbi:hypothetical protein [Stenotrophomonas sp. ATCM1_4]|uniref:hypothetical protein n=1 Tax=Stenotrophomonas sp. ATCM1_4 TaxID=2259330 RepID=UPI001404C442|nr:hypothetical protein [Stenotrophomonas sp. ATCM1_4]